MASRIYIPVFGSGLGHASRMALVAERLRSEGYSIRFSSSFEAVNYLRNCGFRCNEVPGIDIPWENWGSLSGLRRSLRSIPSWTKTFLKQIRCELNNIESYKPTIVLSDTRLSTVLSAWFSETPSFTVINQLRILFPPSYHSMLKPLLRMISVDRLTRLWFLSESILIPDLPPPYTISEKNVCVVKALQRKIRYVGFITPKLNANSTLMDRIRLTLDLPSNKPLVMAQISGPPPTKKVLIKAILDTVKKQNQYFFIITEGIPNGKTEPSKFEGGLYYEWCPFKDELLSLSDVVITRAGHSTIGQLVTMGKPMIVVPIMDHSEQISNASKVCRLGLGRMIEQPDLNAASLCENLNATIDDPKYRENATRMKEVALNYDGVENTLNLLKEFTGG